MDNWPGIGRYLGQENTKVIAVTDIESFFKKSIGTPFWNPKFQKKLLSAPESHEKSSKSSFEVPYEITKHFPSTNREGRSKIGFDNITGGPSHNVPEPSTPHCSCYEPKLQLFRSYYLKIHHFHTFRIFCCEIKLIFRSKLKLQSRIWKT